MTGPAVRSVIVGIDTHKYMHVAVAVSDQGQRLEQLLIVADRGGYEQLLDWARGLGRVQCFGIEGTGSYGQGLTSYLRRHDQSVVEAGRPDRRDRRLNGKSDTLDAENAARAVLAGARPRRPAGPKAPARCCARPRSPKTPQSRRARKRSSRSRR